MKAQNILTNVIRAGERFTHALLYLIIGFLFLSARSAYSNSPEELPYRSRTIEICKGESVYLQGAPRTLAGTFFDTLSYSSGCDSIIITTLVVNSFAGTAEVKTEHETIHAGEKITLQAYPQNGGYQYSWKTANRLSCTDCATPAVYPVYSDTYSVVVTDANGCTAAAEVFIEIKQTPAIESTTARSPF